MLIHTNDQLKKFYLKSQKDKIVGIDTEFYRVDTYFPILCLVQLSNINNTILIDPLKTKIDLDLIKKIILSSEIKKIFHAAHQDIEIFFNLFNCLPKKIIDIQICMNLIGYSESAGYALAVKDFLNIEIDKTHQFVDWRTRPLSKKKILYASNDVKHLIPLYKKVSKELYKFKILNIEKYHKKILDVKRYLREPKDAWQKLRIKRNSNLKIQIIKEICEKREIIAKNENIPVRRLLQDSDIKKIARKKLTLIEAQKIINSIKNKKLQFQVKKILEL